MLNIILIGGSICVINSVVKSTQKLYLSKSFIFFYVKIVIIIVIIMMMIIEKKQKCVLKNALNTYECT